MDVVAVDDIAFPPSFSLDDGVVVIDAAPPQTTGLMSGRLHAFTTTTAGLTVGGGGGTMVDGVVASFPSLCVCGPSPVANPTRPATATAAAGASPSPTAAVTTGLEPSILSLRPFHAIIDFRWVLCRLCRCSRVQSNRRISKDPASTRV